MDYVKLNRRRKLNAQKMEIAFFILAIFLMFLEWVFGGGDSYLLFFTAYILIVAFVYIFSGRIAILLISARKTAFRENPKLYTMVEKLAEPLSFFISKPRIYIVHDMHPNAFSVGTHSKNVIIGVTSGLLERLNEKEIESVVAYQLASLATRDTFISTIAAILSLPITLVVDSFTSSKWFKERSLLGLISRNGKTKRDPLFILFSTFVFFVLSPITALIIRIASPLSSKVEIDSLATSIIKNPTPLARALGKAAGYPYSLGVASSATAHLFFANPFRMQPRSSPFIRTFRMHPLAEERVKSILNL